MIIFWFFNRGRPTSNYFVNFTGVQSTSKQFCDFFIAKKANWTSKMGKAATKD